MSRESASSLILCFVFFGSDVGSGSQIKPSPPPGISQEKNKTAASPPWIKFTQESAGFSILFPATPVESVDSFQQDSVTVPTHMYNLKVGEAMYFVVRMGDVPENLASSTFLESFFNNAYKIFFGYTTKDGKEEITNITNQRAVSLGNYLGHHYESECGPKTPTNAEPCGVILRVYKTNRSIYVLGLTGSKSILTVDHVNRFLDSFSITQ